MAIYAIGDVQGCYAELQDLLAAIDYDPSQDELWFAGDLVSRGPDSLEVLRFIKNLPKKVVVLGNHDIHLLALAYVPRYVPFTVHPSLIPTMKAPDKDELLTWLRQQPLVHSTTTHLLVHAGLSPQWKVDQAQQYASEITLDDDMLVHLYGDEPSEWSERLTGWARKRYIINALTRIRFCTSKRVLDFSSDGPLDSAKHLVPWFHFHRESSVDILFGHWAAIKGNSHQANAVALDTGCVWGGSLTAYHLGTKKRTSVPSRQAAEHKKS